MSRNIPPPSQQFLENNSIVYLPMFLTDKGRQDENIQRQLAKLAREGKNPFDRGVAIKNITDQKLLEEFALHDEIPFVRKEAVQKLEDQHLLGKIAIEDPIAEVRKSAIRLLKDEYTISEVCIRDLDSGVRETALKCLDKSCQEIFANIAINDKNWVVRYTAVWRLLDEDTLSQVALNDPKPEVRKAAVNQFHDEEVFMQIALFDPSDKVKQEAASKLRSQGNWKRVVETSTSAEIREMLVARITDQEFLRNVALMDEGRWVRDTAVNQLQVHGNQDIFKIVATTDRDENVRYTAVRKITDDEVLSDIVKNSNYGDSALAAVQRVQSREILAMLRLSAHGKIQDAILKRITELK